MYKHCLEYRSCMNLRPQRPLALFGSSQTDGLIIIIGTICEFPFMRIAVFNNLTNKRLNFSGDLLAQRHSVLFKENNSTISNNITTTVESAFINQRKKITKMMDKGPLHDDIHLSLSLEDVCRISFIDKSGIKPRDGSSHKRATVSTPIGLLGAGPISPVSQGTTNFKHGSSQSTLQKASRVQLNNLTEEKSPSASARRTLSSPDLSPLIIRASILKRNNGSQTNDRRSAFSRQLSFGRNNTVEFDHTEPACYTVAPRTANRWNHTAPRFKRSDSMPLQPRRQAREDVKQADRPSGFESSLPRIPSRDWKA
jgi:hypothetical protein